MALIYSLFTRAWVRLLVYKLLHKGVVFLYVQAWVMYSKDGDNPSHRKRRTAKTQLPRPKNKKLDKTMYCTTIIEGSLNSHTVDDRLEVLYREADQKVTSKTLGVNVHLRVLLGPSLNVHIYASCLWECVCERPCVRVTLHVYNRFGWADQFYRVWSDICLSADVLCIWDISLMDTFSYVCTSDETSVILISSCLILHVWC